MRNYVRILIYRLKKKKKKKKKEGDKKRVCIILKININHLGIKLIHIF